MVEGWKNGKIRPKENWSNGVMEKKKIPGRRFTQHSNIPVPIFPVLFVHYSYIPLLQHSLMDVYSRREKI
jgi:hypothetical protein